MKRSISLLLILIVCLFAACKKKTESMIPSTPQTVSTTPSEPGPEEVKQNQDLTSAELSEISRQFQPVFFDFNKFDIKDDQVPSLQANAALLKNYPKANLILEGHCDERGTDEYNLALGERRANAVKQYLAFLGVDSNRLQTISFGESKPFAEGHSESAWQENRRAQSVVLKQ